MKKYLLLRDNRQSGPHTIEQMGSFGLHPLDLVWIENESTSWKYPEEIEELNGFVCNHPLNVQSNELNPGTQKVFVSFPAVEDQVNREETSKEYPSLFLEDGLPTFQAIDKAPSEDFSEEYSTHKTKQPVWQRRLFRSGHTASVITIFIGVMIGSFIIKKWVDGYVPGSDEIATAVPINDNDMVKQPDRNIQNALVKEIVPVYKTTATKRTKKTNLRSQLKLASNNYKVGLFGGINGLQLTVFNTSSQPVDKVIVTIDYLKHNGAVVQSENIPFTSIKAKAAQTISIPPSSRGVKLRYKILKVYAHDYKEDLREI